MAHRSMMATARGTSPTRYTHITRQCNDKDGCKKWFSLDRFWRYNKTGRYMNILTGS